MKSVGTPFGASGGGHTSGFVPDPGASQDLTNFCREDATWKTPFTARHISGLELEYLTTTTFNIKAGQCLDTIESQTINNATDFTVNTADDNNYSDIKALAGTVATTNASAAVTGTATAFLTEFGTRAYGVNVGSSGATLSATTATTGRFRTRVAVNDLIGNSTKGYFRVSAITDDDTLMLSSTPGSAFFNEAVNVIETPTINLSGVASSLKRLNTISSDTALTTTTTFGSTNTGKTAYAGYPGVATATENAFGYVWAIRSGSWNGIGACVSTQRTTPYKTGFTSYRRIGTVVYSTDTLGTIIPFYQYGRNNRRDYVFRGNNLHNNSQVLAGGAATTATRVKASGIIPPTSRLAYVTLLDVGTGSAVVYVWGGEDSTLTTSNMTSTANTGHNNHWVGYLPLDWAQQFYYKNNAAAANAYVNVNGYVEEL